MFITGTDTGVGKTIITLAIAKSLKEAGHDVGVMKPVSCGPASENDAILLKKLLNLDDPLELICPVSFEKPLAPYSVAKIQDTRNKLQKRYKKQDIKRKVSEAYKQLCKRHEIVLIEGIGGVMVPITKDYYVIDMIEDFSLPTVVVARAGLGTLNHTLLTIEALRKRNIEIAGVVMNGYKGDDLSEDTNADVIEELGDVKIIAKVGWHE